MEDAHCNICKNHETCVKDCTDYSEFEIDLNIKHQKDLYAVAKADFKTLTDKINKLLHIDCGLSYKQYIELKNYILYNQKEPAFLNDIKINIVS